MFESSVKEALESELIVFPETALIQSRDEIEEWLQSINEASKSKDISLLTGIIASPLAQDVEVITLDP